MFMSQSSEPVNVTTLHGKRDFVGIIKIGISRWGYLGRSSAIKVVLMREMQEELEEAGRVRMEANGQSSSRKNSWMASRH